MLIFLPTPYQRDFVVQQCYGVMVLLYGIELLFMSLRTAVTSQIAAVRLATRDWLISDG